MLFEVIGQVALIGESRHERHERRDGSLGQKLPCSLDTHLDQILVWCQPSRFAKRTNDAERGYSSPLSEDLQRSLTGSGVGMLKHIAYDAHDVRLAHDPARKIQSVIRSLPLRVTADQFLDRNAGGLLSRRFIENRRRVRIARSVPVTESIAGDNRLVERLKRPANSRVTEDDPAKIGRFTATPARGFRVQGRQPDGKVDRQIGQGVDSTGHTSGVHFAWRYHHKIALACESFCSAIPERSSATKNQSEGIGVVAVPRKGLRLVCRSEHFKASAES